MAQQNSIQKKSFLDLLKEFLSDALERREFEIIDIYECKESGYVKAVILLSGRHIIERNISDIVTDLDFLECFNKKTIRTLTYLATVERMKPDYSIVVQRLGNKIDDFILEIKSRSSRNITSVSPSEMTKNKSILSKFSPIDANRIGYLAGIKETINEYKIKPKK